MKEKEEEEDTRRNEEMQEEGERKKVKFGGGCLSWKSLWLRRKRQREKHKPRNNNIFLCHINGCYKH